MLVAYTAAAIAGICAIFRLILHAYHATIKAIKGYSSGHFSSYSKERKNLNLAGESSIGLTVLKSHNIVQLMICDEREEFWLSQWMRYIRHVFAYVAEWSDIVDCFREHLSNLCASLTPPLKRRDHK
jgi:hypothetical protein